MSTFLLKRVGNINETNTCKSNRCGAITGTVFINSRSLFIPLVLNLRQRSQIYIQQTCVH